METTKKTAIEESPICIWKDRKRTIFGLPWSFTVYILESERLVIKTGLFSKKTGEIQLYRMNDVNLNQNIEEQLFRLGSILILSSDALTPKFMIKRIKESKKIWNLISRMKEEAKIRRGTAMHESFISGSVDHDGQDGQDEDHAN